MRPNAALRMGQLAAPVATSTEGVRDCPITPVRMLRGAQLLRMLRGAQL